MPKSFQDILNQTSFSKSDLVTLLSADEQNRKLLFGKSASVKHEYVGNKVYYRGLIEFSNLCGKDCL